MIEGLVLEERHVELVGHERRANVVRECRVALHRWQVARAATFVGHRVLLVDAESKGRVVVEEERGDVVVVDHDEHVGLGVADPLLDRHVCLEDGRPDRIVLLLLVVGEPDGGCVRRCHCSDDPGHGSSCHCLVFTARSSLPGLHCLVFTARRRAPSPASHIVA
jgi:hypothetical protein